MPAASTATVVRQHTLTIPEQIADQVGIAILKGEYEAGEHIPEQELAMQFRVSHGPVRDALRILERHGMIDLLPRRGAFAVEVSLDSIADAFNIRAALLGLAANQLARHAKVAMLAMEVTTLTEKLVLLAQARNTDPLEFAHACGRVGNAIYRNCGNTMLMRALADQNRRSLWGLLWREHTLDFLGRKRRIEAAEEWMAAAAAIQNRNSAKAEACVRKALFDSRDGALATLKSLRRGLVDPSKFIR